MISLKVYKKQIRDLEIEGMEISPANSHEANILLKNLGDIESYLEQVRYNIRMDIRAIRRDYMERIREISNPINFKGSKEKLPIKEKKELISHRDIKIASYESIEYLVDDYLIQIKGALKYINTYLKKSKEN
ncbi:MAG: hypothetical protein ACXVHO_04685 [Methanobacterium sp.]